MWFDKYVLSVGLPLKQVDSHWVIPNKGAIPIPTMALTITRHRRRNINKGTLTIYLLNTI